MTLHKKWKQICQFLVLRWWELTTKNKHSSSSISHRLRLCYRCGARHFTILTRRQQRLICKRARPNLNRWDPITLRTSQALQCSKMFPGHQKIFPRLFNLAVRRTWTLTLLQRRCPQSPEHAWRHSSFPSTIRRVRTWLKALKSDKQATANCLC